MYFSCAHGCMPFLMLKKLINRANISMQLLNASGRVNKDDDIYNMIKTNGPKRCVMAPNVFSKIDGGGERSEVTQQYFP